MKAKKKKGRAKQTKVWQPSQEEKRRGWKQRRRGEGKANKGVTAQSRREEEGMKAKKKRGGQSKQRCDSPLSPVKKRRGEDESEEEEGRAKQTEDWRPSQKKKRRGWKQRRRGERLRGMDMRVWMLSVSGTTEKSPLLTVPLPHPLFSQLFYFSFSLDKKTQGKYK
jgi:hypothetical protein